MGVVPGRFGARNAPTVIERHRLANALQLLVVSNRAQEIRSLLPSVGTYGVAWRMLLVVS
jgi:hypothetical protein